jgi:aspartate aminotransferase
MICLNSPLNPTGTTVRADDLKELLEGIVNENLKRASRNQRPLYLLYDQIYWMLNFNDTQRHPFPHHLVPESKPYVVYVDGISKYFCSTGLRVGWGVAPKNITQAMSNFLGHVGAWAPKPEQKALAVFLKNSDAISSYVKTLKQNLKSRLVPLYEGIQKLKSQGAPIDAINPEGAIYLSLQIKDKNGPETNEAKRKRLLEETGIAVVPFQAFGLKEESGWFRMSVGAVSQQDIQDAVQLLARFNG